MSPPPDNVQVPIIKPLEGLRGVLALVVAFVHLYISLSLDGIRGFGVLRPLLLSGEAVMGFFVLSGFVIMHAHKNDAFDGASIKKYYLKRIRRLYGIYVAALVITILFKAWGHWQSLTWQNVAANLFFLQKYSGDPASWRYPLLGNFPLWSLPFEVFYYIIFPWVMFLGKKTGPQWLTVIVLGALAYACTLPTDWDGQVASMLHMSALWWLGALMATDWFKSHIRKCPAWIAWFSMGVIPMIGRFTKDQNGLTYVSILLVPLFAHFTLAEKRKGQMEKDYTWMIHLIPFVTFAYMIFWAWMERNTDPSKKTLSVLMPYFIFCICTGFLGWAAEKKPSFFRGAASILIKLGGLSYALYLIHNPVFFVLTERFKGNRSPVILIAVTIASLGCAIALAWLLETPLQKTWSHWFSKRFGLVKK